MVLQILVIALVISSIAALAPSQPTLLRRSGRYLGGRFKPKRQISGQRGGVTLAKLSTGPFAVRAIETPRVANTAGNAPRTSRKLHDNSPDRSVFCIFTPQIFITQILHTYGEFVYGAFQILHTISKNDRTNLKSIFRKSHPSLFETEDGRVFALSNGKDLRNFGPGQIFRTEEGKFFSLAIAGERGFLVPAKRPLLQPPSRYIQTPELSRFTTDQDEIWCVYAPWVDLDSYQISSKLIEKCASYKAVYFYHKITKS